MQSVSSRIWTRVAVFISYDDNHYTMGTSKANTWLIVLVEQESARFISHRMIFQPRMNKPVYSKDYIYIYIYIYIKLATVVEGEQKAHFSIATTPRYRRGHIFFLGLLYFTLDTDLILPSVKEGGNTYHFKSLWYDVTWDWTQVSRSIIPYHG